MNLSTSRNLIKAAAFSGLAIFSLISGFASLPAYAGFTTPFSSNDWALNGSTTFPSCDEYYGTTGSTGCADIISAPDGDAFVGGAQAPLSETTTTWSWLNDTGQDYYVSFNYDFSAYLATQNQYATITVGDSYYADTRILPSGYVDSKLVAQGDSITFSIVVPTSNNAAGLDITGFNYAVPAPLPAAGAASAFGFSRRLRRRVKGQRLPGERPRPRTPVHPSAYLSLAPAALQNLPLSFHYCGAVAASPSRSVFNFSQISSAAASGPSAQPSA